MMLQHLRKCMYSRVTNTLLSPWQQKCTVESLLISRYLNYSVKVINSVWANNYISIFLQSQNSLIKPQTCAWTQRQSLSHSTENDHKNSSESKGTVKSYGVKIQSKSKEGSTEEKDILIYAYNNSVKFLAMMGFILSMTFYLMKTAVDFYYVGISLRSRNEQDEDNPAKKPTIFGYSVDMYQFKNGDFHTAIAAVVAVIGVLLCAVATLLPGRSVRGIVLLKNDKICIKTFAPFGPSQYVTLPVSEVSSGASDWSSRGMIVRSKRHRLPFYLNGGGKVVNMYKFQKIFYR